MNDGTSILDGLDPEILDRMSSRRDAVRGAGRVGAALALGSVPVAFAAGAAEAFGAGANLPLQIVDILNFALTLEYLESEFYTKATAKKGLIPHDRLAIFNTIRSHEDQHAQFLKMTLKSKATPKPQFDFTAGGKFDPLGDYKQFLLVSQGFEDTGVRAYKGQAPNLVGHPDVLTSALRIHSVEARHAAEVRRLRMLKGWIPLDQPNAPAAVKMVYAGMGETKKFGVDVPVAAAVSAKEATEAFDEPLDKASVLKIAAPFLKGVAA